MFNGSLYRLCDTSCICKELHSTPDFIHESELKDLCAGPDHKAQQQQRACERGDIFRSFSGDVLHRNMLTNLLWYVNDCKSLAL